MIMKNNQQIGNITNGTVVNANVNGQHEENNKFTVKEFMEKIKNGEIKLSVDEITGLHGGVYVRKPAVYDSKDGVWSYTEFEIDGTTSSIPTVTINGKNWYHMPAFLRMTNLIVEESDYQGFENSIPYMYRRYYSPFGKGVKRMFITMEAIEQLGFSSNGKPMVKRKVHLEYSGVTTLHINLDFLAHSINKIIGQLKSIDDRAFLCDVYRVLKQLE
jgi:hypothetical protein